MNTAETSVINYSQNFYLFCALPRQDRKRVAEIAKLQLQHVNQQVVLRRKAEEAAAANNRLKEVLLRQKLAADDRSKKQETADLSGIGARVRVNIYILLFNYIGGELCYFICRLCLIMIWKELQINIFDFRII